MNEGQKGGKSCCLVAIRIELNTKILVKALTRVEKQRKLFCVSFFVLQFENGYIKKAVVIRLLRRMVCRLMVDCLLFVRIAIAYKLQHIIV